MTRTRALVAGPRTIAHSAIALLLLSFLVIVAGVIACGPAASPQAGSAAPGPSSVAVPDPSGSRWPGTTVLAVLALGAADAELKKAGDDLVAAADRQDLKAMWGAADGLAKLIDDLTPQIDRLDAYPGTQSIARLYRKAFPVLGAGAKQLRDAITSGNGAGVLAGSQQISRGLAEYAPIRREIGPLVEQAILQRRFLVK